MPSTLVFWEQRTTSFDLSFEWQHRGSPHIHGIAWFPNAPDVEKLLVTDDDSDLIAAVEDITSYQCLQPWLGAFSIFLPFFSILMAILVFLIFLAGAISNSRKWEVVKLSLSPKRPFFFTYQVYQV